MVFTAVDNSFWPGCNVHCTVTFLCSDKNGFSSLETNVSHLYILSFQDLTKMLIVCDGPGQIVKLWERQQHGLMRFPHPDG